MEKDLFWELFRDTGDPLCWLLTRTGPGQTKSQELPRERETESASAPR